MLKNAYSLAKIGGDTAENEQHFAEILTKFPSAAEAGGCGNYWQGTPGGKTLRGNSWRETPGGKFPARKKRLLGTNSWPETSGGRLLVDFHGSYKLGFQRFLHISGPLYTVQIQQIFANSCVTVTFYRRYLATFELRAYFHDICIL